MKVAQHCQETLIGTYTSGASWNRTSDLSIIREVGEFA